MKPFERGTPPANIVIADDIVWLNDKYQVNVREDKKSGMTWLSIKRLDKESIHDWRDLQTIKNMLTHPEREAIELYPAESRLVDSSNQYHLWVLPLGQKVPVGWDDRIVVKGQKGGWQKAGQRDFNEDEVPADAITPEEAEKRAQEYIKEKEMEAGRK
jgi:hypothetical protein